MNTDALKYQIAITRIKGIGNIIAKNLIAYTGSVEAIFKQSKGQLMKIPNVGEYVASQIVRDQSNALMNAEKETEFILKNKIIPLFFTDEDYPYRLKECVDAPVIIYSKGNQNFNKGRFVGVVGTRKITEYGKSLCSNLIKDLAHNDITVVSGLAYGVDICAHKYALECGLNTIGVLGHGLDRIYPSVHRSTAVKMVQQGALLTEYQSGTNPDRQNFIQRNRIIAGLVDVLVVIESAKKGGSLVTADIAGSYNRDVVTFPGRVNDEYSTGCNNLIKTNKAALIENASDLEKIMGWEQTDKNKNPELSLFTALSDIEKQIISLIRVSEALHVNQIALKLELPMSKISPLLLEMEFKGLLKCLPGNLYRTT